MTCNIKPNKIDHYIPENHEFDDFLVDQAVLIKEEYLEKVQFFDYKAEPEDVCEPTDSYPFVNSYYNHTEDTDALSKVNALLAQPDILEINRERYAQESHKYDAYSEREAQTRYLESRPVSFIILGKPDIGQQELGRQLANFWNCVYIEPETLIEEEIESGNRAGECIEFNLRCGRAIGIDIILKLVKKRVKSETARHRGFVICGVPVISNDLYEEDPVSSQSAIFTAKDIFEEIFEEAVKDPYVSQSKPQVSVSSKYQSDVEKSAAESQNNDSEREVSSPKGASVKKEEKIPVDLGEESLTYQDIGQNYEEQLNFLFDLLEDPFFIIYIQCGTMDVLNKRDSYRFDLTCNQILDTQRRTYNKIFRNYFVFENDLDVMEEIYDPNFLDIDDFRLKYLVKLPRDFKANISSQLDRYHYAALNFIQFRVVAHNPEYFIKVDGRTNIGRMLSIVEARLKIMNLQQVLVPRKLTDTELDAYFKTDDTLLAEDHETPRTEDGLRKPTPEECFRQLKKKQVPSQSYIWTWSEWGTKCPVSLKYGFIKEGNIKYPVQFMNKLFFLADYNAYLKFYRNPRPFLLPPYPRSTCKIFIFGPKLSGRSALAQCLAYYLNGTVLSTDDIMNKYLHQRQYEYLEKVRQQAIAEGIALLNENRKLEAEEKESERIEQIKEWVKNVVSLLEQMMTVLEEIEKEEKKEQFEISSFPMAMKRAQTTELLDDSEFAIALSKIREELNNLNIPIYKMDGSTWKPFITERKKLLTYLPPNLAQKTQVKPATVFDDFVKDYVEKALSKAGFDSMNISGGGILELFISQIKEAEQKYQAQGYGQGGWIVDGMLSNVEIVKNFYPDYLGDEILVLKDDNKFLVQRYRERGTSFFRDFRNFFIASGMKDAAWRSPSVVSTDQYKEGLVKSVLDEILESDDFYDKPTEDAEQKGEIYSRIDGYKKEIETFQKNWKKVKQFYLNHNITPTEIDVSNKTLPELFKEVIQTIGNRYGYQARQFTEEDRSEEVTKLLVDQKAEDPAAGEASTIADVKSEDAMENVRQYGDTRNFCPITLMENFVLWKGKEEFGVKFNDKVYLMSTELDMKKFLKEPLKFIPQSYPKKLPPPRICLIGVSGCGRTSLSQAISANYGLIYLSYERFFKNSFNIEGSETLKELRNSPGKLRSYLNGEKSVPYDILSNLKKYWFNEPFKYKGFVFDDFPKTHYDVEFMAENKFIPDVVICPQADETYLKTKFLARSLALWQENVDKQRLESELRHAMALDRWKEQRTVRFNILMEERREHRYAKKKKDKINDTIAVIGEDASDVMKSVSQVTFDSVAEQEDVDEVNKLLDVELPPIIYEIPVEDPQAFIAKTKPVINALVQTEIETVTKVKEKCLSLQIPYTEIPLNLDDLSKTRIASYLVVEPLKFRNLSFLESCYDVSLEMAKRLLSSGYLFLSKFGKTCPVQYFENENPLQMYLVAEQNNNLYPVIHRSYIYFIVGLKQKAKFKDDPLKYINQEFKFPLIRYKVAVTGPPKCGKTILAQRFQKEFGFKLVTRGQAARYVLKYLCESDLAKNMESVLRKGWELTDEMVLKAVEASSFDKRVVTQGVVFDGFPNSLNEVKHMSYIDLVPNIIIDLQANEDEILECLSHAQPNDGFPKFGRGFIKHLYEEWKFESEEFRVWFDKEYQAMTKIPIDTCNWSVWHKSKGYLLSTFWEIKHYHRYISDDWPLRLGNMLVTPLEFLERSSCFKTYCPLCLHFSNTLVNGGEPPDRTGVVQFRKYLYWLCNDHIELFLKSPEMYLPPYTKHGMPSNLPKRSSFQEMPDNVYENGACAVCYKTKRIITKGRLSLSASYNEKAYLFDSVECLNVFLKSPQSFLFGIEFRTPVYPELKYQELPVMGMLEQYVAKYIVKGISFIAKRRPIIPGLGISASALVGLGAFIKVKNENLAANLKPYYEEGFRLYNERVTKLVKYLDVMKTYRNPYLYYQEPLPDFRLPPGTPRSETPTTFISRIVDQCIDNVNMYLPDPSISGNGSDVTEISTMID